MKIVKLNVHGRPVHELRSRSVLAEGLIVGQPNTTTELAIRAQNEKLVRSEIFPPVRKIRRQNQRKNCKGFGPGHDVLDAATLLFSAWQKH